MNRFSSILKELANSNLAARYSGILSLSNIALLLANEAGEVMLEFSPSPDFCTYVCHNRDDELCCDFLNQFGNAPRRFTCKHGLVNTIQPITVENQTIGYIAGMQVYCQDTEHQKFLIHSKRYAKERGMEAEFVAKTVSALRTVEDSKLDIHEHVCAFIASNISVTLIERANHKLEDFARLSIEKEILEKKIIDLEAKNMSLEINPHFLFNTLNCIARTAYYEKAYTTEELIYCLSDLLRYNLKQENQLHTIESEVDNIEKYLHIQKVRFKNRLEYSIDVDKSIKPYRIPNMVLQPIVENAVIHGITPKREGGRIDVRAERNDDVIDILVIDNGNGFPREILDGINRNDKRLGIGFQSTNQRLKRYFGETYGLSVLKSDYSGSTVLISIPTHPIAR